MAPNDYRMMSGATRTPQTLRLVIPIGTHRIRTFGYAATVSIKLTSLLFGAFTRVLTGLAIKSSSEYC
jgi:hypothetical protein